MFGDRMSPGCCYLDPDSHILPDLRIWGAEMTLGRRRAEMGVTS